MPNYDSGKHDIGILRADGATKVGLMLVHNRQTDGTTKPMYRQMTEKYLLNQYYAGAPDYGALDPQSELPIIQDDYRSGFGLEVADSSDPKRYFSSIGMDLRFRGMAIAGPTPTTVTKPDTLAALVITNKDMEATGTWSVAGRSSTHAYAGTYGWKVNNNTSSQAALTWDDAWRGKTFTFSCWVWCAGAVGAVRIFDGQDRTASGNHTGSSAWELLTATRTLDAAASELTVELYSHQATDVWFDDAQLQCPGTGKTVAWKDFNDKLYMASGQTISVLNATTGTAFDQVGGVGGVITDLEDFTDDQLYIPIGLTDSYWQMTTVPALTRNNLENNKMQFMSTVFTTAATMYGNDAVNKIRSTVAPASSGTAWSNPQTLVGASYHNITDLLDKSGALYIPKEDMPYYLNSSGVAQNDLAPELVSLTCSTSGKNSYIWKNKLYIPCGAQGLLETDGTTNTFLNPAGYCTNLSDFVGKVEAVAGDEEYLYISVNNATKHEILAGRSETIDGTTSWVWHPIAEITFAASASVETMYISSVYQKRLWVASNDATDSIYYIPLPVGYGDMENDANKLFKTDTYFITPWYHGGFKGETKAWVKATATLGHTCDADIYFECWYQKKGDSSWTDAGDFKGTATNRIATLYLPNDASGNKPVSPMMRFKIVAKTNTAAKTPVLLNFDVRTILRPTHRKIIECVVRAGDNILDKHGQLLDGTSAAYVRTVLDEARDATWPFTWYDISGTTKYGVMLPAEPYSEVATTLKNENPEEIFYLRIQEIALS